MVIYGWDASHYDGPLNRTILARAAAEGITFFTHKVAEGLADTEGTMDDTALAAARDAGIPFVGGYLVPRTSATAAAQVSRWLQLLEAGEPWWHTYPGWFFQVDLERWPYDNVPAAVGIDCARRLRDATGRTVILYASRGQYGDQLGAWDGPLWNASYVGRAASGFAAMYPGDGWATGWAPYSGKTPAILQYTSAATIAGLTTCDANAFRGSVADFARLIGGDDMLKDEIVPNTSTPGTGDRSAAELLRDMWRALMLGDTQGGPLWGSSPFAKLLAAAARPVAIDAAALAAGLAPLLADHLGVAVSADQLVAALNSDAGQAALVKAANAAEDS